MGNERDICDRAKSDDASPAEGIQEYPNRRIARNPTRGLIIRRSRGLLCPADTNAVDGGSVVTGARNP
jgi:hypothetical protein